MPRPAEVVGWELHQGLWELENSQDTWKLASHANESAATMLELDGGLVVLERVALLMLLPFSANGKQPTMAGTILGLL